jgi:NifU-like protein involved in Fe-S cluster formation
VRSWVRQSHAAVQGDERLGFPELEGMAKLPARQRCATLPWDSLDAALERSTRGGDAP